MQCRWRVREGKPPKLWSNFGHGLKTPATGAVDLIASRIPPGHINWLVGWLVVLLLSGCHAALLSCSVIFFLACCVSVLPCHCVAVLFFSCCLAVLLLCCHEILPTTAPPATPVIPASALTPAPTSTPTATPTTAAPIPTPAKPKPPTTQAAAAAPSTASM